jgi:hypothetical protein
MRAAHRIDQVRICEGACAVWDAGFGDGASDCGTRSSLCQSRRNSQCRQAFWVHLASDEKRTMRFLSVAGPAAFRGAAHWLLLG